MGAIAFWFWLCQRQVSVIICSSFSSACQLSSWRALVWVGVTGGDVALASWHDAVGDGFSAGLFEGFYHLQHAVAFGLCLGSSSARLGFALGSSGRRRGLWRGLPHGCSRARRCRLAWVVVAKDAEFFELADADLGDVGQEVVGDAAGVFADLAAGVRADWVEVAQYGNAQAWAAVA